jgi:GAF domain-containing protein
VILDDPQRLRALERSGLLRHPLGEQLNRLCYTAQQLLNADAVQLNALTETHQVHIAEWPRVKRDDIPITTSGCQSVAVAGVPIVIPNTIEHPVTCVMPWSATWQGYMGVPLKHEGQTIGSLCALTHEPRQWRDIDVTALQALAAMAMGSLQSVDRDGQPL